MLSRFFFFLLGNSSCRPACAVNSGMESIFGPGGVLTPIFSSQPGTHGLHSCTWPLMCSPGLDGWLQGDRLEGKRLNCPHSHCRNANSPPRAEKPAPSSCEGNPLCERRTRSCSMTEKKIKSLFIGVSIYFVKCIFFLFDSPCRTCSFLFRRRWGEGNKKQAVQTVSFVSQRSNR